MTQILGSEEQGCLQFDNDAIKQLYDYVSFIANFRYKRAIEVLQTRHKTYSVEDFIQDVMQIICTQMSKKSFPTINHAKSFANKIAEFHYLKEKRKYFFTKQRGDVQEVYIYDDFVKNASGDVKCVVDILTYDMEEADKVAELIDLHNLTQKNLFVVYNWKNLLEVCTLQELKNYKEGYALSVNYFIQTLREHSIIDACRHFKEKGFFMTRKTLNIFSQKIVQYVKEHDLLEVNECDFPRYKNSYKERQQRLDRRNECSRKCTCGYEYKESLTSEDFWQCPECGRIHDKEQLIKFNSGELFSYEPQTTKSIKLTDRFLQLSKV